MARNEPPCARRVASEQAVWLATCSAQCVPSPSIYKRSRFKELVRQLYLLDVQASDLSGLPPVLIQADAARRDPAARRCKPSRAPAGARRSGGAGRVPRHVPRLPFQMFVRKGEHAVANAGHFICTHAPRGRTGPGLVSTAAELGVGVRVKQLTPF
jgi:hypothetical protein